MRYCDGCHFPILEADSEERRRWCRSIRGILKLEDAQPEDYHEKCFVDFLLDANKRESAEPKRARKSMPPNPTAPSPSWAGRGG